MGARRNLLAAGGAIAAAGTSWALAQRADKRAIAADPNAAELNVPLRGRRRVVRSFDGTDLNVEEFGPETGPPLILVHGWTCALRFWTRQIQRFEKERRIIAFDLRGHGESGRSPEGDYSIEAFARDLEVVVEDAVGEGERAVVVGHSLGAMAIVAAAHDDPVFCSQVSEVGLLNTGIGDLISGSLVLASPRSLDRVQRLVGQAVLSARAPIPVATTPLSSRIVHYVALGPDASPAEVAFCESLVIDCPTDVRGACGGTLSKLDLFDAVESLAIPALVVAGGKDRLTPPEHARRLADDVPELIALEIIERSGHMSPVEDPERINELLAGLLDRSEAAAAASPS